MAQGIAHEKMRFQQMTERQLWTRLGKISTPEKLERFASMAEEYGYPDLSIAAKGRLSRLTGTEMHIAQKPKQAEAASDGRLLRRLDV